MFSNYLKLTFRNLWRNKVFVLSNVLGLGIAIACCIVAFLNWDYNRKFDTVHQNIDQIYRVNFTRITNGNPIPNGSSPLPLGEQIAEGIPQVDQTIRISPTGGNFRVETDLFGTSVWAVDDNFFDVFTFKMIHGNSEQLSDKLAIFISEELRQRHFPDIDNPVGRTMTYVNADKEIEYRVAGVFEDLPDNTSFYSDAYFNYDNIYDLEGWDASNWAIFNNTFVLVKDPSNISSIEGQLQEYVEVQNRAKEDYKVQKFYLDPFRGMAVRAENEGVWNHWYRSSLPQAAAVAPGIMSGLLLLLACFNFTNTSIAIANRRIKEIGVRKVLGSEKKQLIVQFMGENFVLVLMSLLTGLAIAAWLVPAYSAMWAFLTIELDLLSNLDLVAFLLVLVLVTALLAGSYPAFYVSSFEPSAIFRKSVKFKGTNWLTRILLTFQFSIALIAIVCGFVFSRNAVFQEQYDLGYDSHGAVSVWTKDESGYNMIRNALLAEPEIASMSGSRHGVARSWYTDPVKINEEEFDVRLMDVGSGYLETVGATLLNGRDFTENSDADRRSGAIVSEAFLNMAGWNEDAIGNRIILRDTVQLNVVGVIKDIYVDGGLWQPVEPLLLRYTMSENYTLLTVRTDPENLSSVKTAMDNAWKAAFPDELSTVQTMDDQQAEMLEVNRNIRMLFLFLGGVAILLTIFGLYSLVSLNINKRMKEIGVRRVLGASTGNISFRLSREFVIILIIASILGSAASYFLSEMLMASIWAYYAPPNAFAFIGSIAILLVVSAVAIGGKVFTASTVNPAGILRDE